MSIVLLLLVGVTACNDRMPTADQAEEVEPKKLATEPAAMQAVVDLFDAMRAGDSSAMAQVLPYGIPIKTVYEREGKVEVYTSNSTQLLQQVGTPHEQVYDERISSLKVMRSGHLATAWMDYAFYLDTTVSHCGVNTITFYQNNGQWQVLSLADTREACPLDN